MLLLMHIPRVDVQACKELDYSTTKSEVGASLLTMWSELKNKNSKLTTIVLDFRKSKKFWLSLLPLRARGPLLQFFRFSSIFNFVVKHFLSVVQ